MPSAENNTPYFVNYICHQYDPSKLDQANIIAFRSLFSGKNSQEYTTWKKTFNLNHVISLTDYELIELMKKDSYFVDRIRDFAIKMERKNLNLSFRLMSLCKQIRPKGPYIEKKLNEYIDKLAGTVLEF